MKVYDYGIFYENGMKDTFYLEYGPEESRGEETLIGDWRNNEYIKRFDEENDGVVLPGLEKRDEAWSIAFILVNPPRELEE